MAPRPDGLPEIVPDFVEQDHPDHLDNIVPTRGYDMLPMIGLGGSAGSLPALQEFFRAAPEETGMAFVVIVHLSPEHASMMPELLARCTTMRVRAVENGDRAEANCVYVIPPGKHLASADGRFLLTDLEPVRGTRVAVDLFFRSLADTHGPHAAAVVLSGADGDGAIGIRRIKERGGLTIAQDPEEAEHRGMPQSAIATGMVDWVLRVGEIPGRIIGYHASEARLRVPPEDGPQPAQVPKATPDEAESALREVLAFLHMRTGRDFSYYKRATIVRRISRRMQINSVDDLPTYLSFLRTHPGESGALLQDLLISVTNFFRDRDSFDALELLIPELFRGKGAGDQVRVWVPACATGEEAYSVAMLLIEHARSLDVAPGIQIFACDLDENAVALARAGAYPETIAADVSEERLRRFFLKEARGFRVRRELREIVLFAAHDLLKDAPFSRMDLISCRNLFIYLNPDAQRRALDIFHFAMRPAAILFLGSSESVEEGSALFAVLEKKHRIYRHRAAQRLGLPVPLGAGTLQRALAAQEQARNTPVLPGRSFARSPAMLLPVRMPGLDAVLPAAPGELHARFVEELSPPSVLVNADHEIVHLSENAGRFLTPSGGEPTADLLRMVNPTLRAELRGALFRAAESGAPAEVTGVTMELAGARRGVTLRVSPAPRVAPGFLLIVFELSEGSETPEGATVSETSSAGAESTLHQLERETELTKARLRDTVERYEASTEELKASNEELQAMNEELRSAGEELETSREELQSINEELTTVNTELKSRVEELNHANSDLHNLMASTAIATVFLDRELRITRYTPRAVALFRLIPSDLGRPLADLRHQLEYSDLSADCLRVLENLTPIEREVRAEACWYLARLLPYRTLDDHIGGVVLTFVDITEGRRTAEALRTSEQRLQRMVNVPRVGVLTFDYAGVLLHANDAFLAMVGYERGEFEAQQFSWRDFTPAEHVEASERMMEAIQTAGRGGPYEKEYFRKDGARLWMMFVAADLGDGTIVEYALDVSDRRRAEEAMRESEERLRTLADAVPQIIWANSGDGVANYFNRRWYEYSGLSFEESAGLGWEAIVHPDDAPASTDRWQRALAAGEVFDTEYRLRGADGNYRWFIGRNVPMRNGAGQVTGWFGTATDIQALKEAEAAVREREEQFRRAIEDAPIPVIMHAEDGQVLQISSTWTELTGYTREDIPTFEAWINRAYGPGAEVVRDHVRQLFCGERRLLDVELEVTTRTGERRCWAFNASAPGALHDGRRYVVGMALDVTERKAVEAALRESQERVRLVVENAREYAIFSLGLDRRILSWNAGAQAILGWSQEEAIGQSGDIIFTAEDRADGAPEREAATALVADRADDERWHVRKDGSRFWGSGVMTAMHDADGKAIGLVKIFRDQTAELHAKEALEQSLKETEHARAEAEAAGRAKDHFFAVLSHELRTPLTPVLMASQALARRSDLPSTVTEALAMISRNVRLEARFIDDLLDLTRISRGKLEIVRAPADLYEAVRRAVEVCEPDIQEKRQRLEIALEAPEHTLNGDFLRLQQVLWNLLINASKFTPEDGEIRVRSRQEAPGWIAVEVSDTGIGIEADALARIFHPFEQGDASIMRQFGGLGLGLAISHAIVEAHDGRLQGDSGGPGFGATFTVHLPLAASGEPAGAPPPVA